MIARITGRLESIDGTAALVCIAHGPSELAYEVLLPAVAAEALAARIGEQVRLETMEYLEPVGNGTSFVPRLIGFRSTTEREFFDLLTTVKGLGIKKSLRAIAAPVERIARAVEEKDAPFLRTLPEVGKRLAETMIAELTGKVEAFIVPGAPELAQGGRSDAARQALAALLQLGESRSDAETLIQRALATDASLTTPDEVLALALSLRS